MKSVALVTGHAEVLAPGRPGFGALRALLAAEGASVEAVERPRYPAELRGFDALVLGAPQAPLDADELDALADAVERGARLLLLATAGGERPFGDPARRTNLSALLPGLAFHDDALHFASSFEGAENLVVELPLRGLPGLREGEVLRYASGCTFVVEPGRLQVLASVAASGEGLLACHDLQPDYADVLTGARPDSVRPAQGLAFAQLRFGRGEALVLGGAHSLRDEYLSPAFAAWLLARLLALEPGAELAHRMRKPQRHRLLQGYPMAPLMPRADRQAPPRPAPAPGRPLLVGVLPHPYCNPTVEGCGFCTFPQEKLERSRLPELARAVLAELDDYAAHARPRPEVAGLYLGGATANLTPQPEFEALLERLGQVFGLGEAEITLEGVPRYFQIGEYALMRALQARFPRAARRISMGVQTLDGEQLAAMGRSGFGDAATFGAVVERAHALGFSASCDLLINLPGQSVERMLADVEGVAALGYDQVCLYHLVLFEGLGTPWAREPAKLAALPSNGQALESWRRCRERLLELGFAQTTLTNFERPPRPGFRYEPWGYQPDRYDLLGFGPAAISLWSEPGFQGAVKTLNPTLADAYLAPGRPERRVFRYQARDLRLLFLTRSLASLAIDTARYQALFGAPVQADFGPELEALLARELLRERAGRLELSPEGMFYADAAAGLLAWRRVQELRARPEPGQPAAPPVERLRLRDPNDSTYGSMG